jgi:hypothetical protein
MVRVGVPTLRADEPQRVLQPIACVVAREGAHRGDDLDQRGADRGPRVSSRRTGAVGGRC